MRAVKFFKALEYGYSEMEAEINRWIEKHQVEVVDVKIQLAPQSASNAEPLGEMSQSDVLAVVIYEKK